MKRREDLFNEIKTEVMTKESEVCVSEISGGEFFRIFQVGDGFVLVDNQTRIASKERTKKIIEGLQKTVDNFPVEEYDKSINRYVNQILDVKMEYQNMEQPKPKENKPPEKGYIYFLKAFDGKMKIGKAKNLRQRIEQLEKKFGELELVNSFYVIGTRRMERVFHEHFSYRNYTGEWFVFNDEEMKQIASGSFPEYIQYDLNAHLCEVKEDDE